MPRDAPQAPDAHPTLGKPTAMYAYKSATGALGGYIYRFDDAASGKEFRPAAFCSHSVTGDRAWRWKGFDPPRPLYNLDRLAERPGAPVVVCEGEKSADAAARLLPDHVAVTSSGGANAAAKADWGILSGRRVILWPDADEAGRKFAAAVVRRLNQTSAQVSIVAPPEGVRTTWDAADAEIDGWDHDRALALVAAAPPAAEAMRGAHGATGGPAAAGSAENTNEKGGGTSPGERGGGGPPQRNLIIEALGDIALWHNADREAFASLPVNGHVEHWPVRSRGFRIWTAGRYFAEYGGAAAGQAMQDALAVLEAMAIHHGPRHPTWRRVAEHGGAIYHDLCDDAWRAVEITAEGWRVVDRSPVKFLRSPAMRSLPEPEAGGLIEGLRGFLNVDVDEDFQLVVGCLVAGLRPKGPYPILILNGEQGAAKSTTARVIRGLLDPNAAPIRSEPRDDRDLFIDADNNWMISLDNLSGIKARLSDALCRLSTGGALATRELHTDRSEVVLEATRPILLNGITALDARPDLGNRSLVIVLPPIGAGKRRTEAEFWTSFEAAQPEILGALYDAVSCALRRVGGVKPADGLRLADFAQWVTAAEPALGWASGSFNEAYVANEAMAVRNVLGDNPLAQAIRKLAEESSTEESGEWEGSASDLLLLLDSDIYAPEAARKHRSWPGTATALGAQLGRLAPSLRTVSVNLEYARVGHARRRTWIIRQRDDK